MHLEDPQMYQMNRQINSFQNMFDMLYAKIDCLARKIYFVQKQHHKIAYFGGHESGWPDPNGHQTVDTRSTWGLPLKTSGYVGSN